MKKKALLSSVLTIVLCLSLIAGSTFALFTSESTVNIAVTSGKVKVVATATEPVLTWDDSLNDEVEMGTTVSSNGKLVELNLLVPGAKVNFDIELTNNSNVTVQYRTKFILLEGEELWNALTVSVTGDDTIDGTKWTQWPTTDKNTKTLHVSIEFPVEKTEPQGASCKLAYIVEAVQGNAEMPDEWDGETVTPPQTDADGVYQINTAAEFVSFITTVNAGGIYCHQTISINKDIDLGGAIIKTTAEQKNRHLDGVKIEGNGHTISNFVIDSTANPEGYYGGLFGYMAGYHESYIKDLNVRNATVIGGKQTGVIIGGINGENSTVENCKVYDCTIIGEKKVGAVVGYTANGIVKDCYAENCVIYSEVQYADDDEKIQASEVVGYINIKDAGCKDNVSANNNSHKNVTINFGAISTVTNAAELSTALHKGGNVLLLNDIVLTEAWTPIRVDAADAYHPIADTLSIDGNGHSISGLTASLLSNNPARYVTIENLTIKDSNILSGEGNNANCGAFVSIVDDGMVSFEMKNCHAVNVNITAKNSTTGEATGEAFGAGVLVGENGMLAQGKTFKITDCTVTGGSVTNTDGNAAGIVGLCGTPATISNCTVSGVIIKGEKSEKEGQIAGTVNGSGTLTISGCTYEGNAFGRNVGATVDVK